MKNTIHFTLNKSLSRESLTGASPREAISTDRLNYTESMKLQPFTPGLNISKSRKQTNSAHSYGCMSTCQHQWGRNSCCTGFQKSRDFPPTEKQSIGMCHGTRCHVNYIHLLRLKQTVIEALSR